MVRPKSRFQFITEAKLKQELKVASHMASLSRAEKKECTLL